MMGIPEAKSNRSRKGSRLCLNSTRLKGISDEVITFPDSAPSSPLLRNDKDHGTFIRSVEVDSSPNPTTPTKAAVAPVASFYNLGNTCFMNCMLQVLRFTPEFLQLLRRLRAECDQEEKHLASEENQLEKTNVRLGRQLLKNLDDMYSEMALKESQHKLHLPSSNTALALQPCALLDSIRLLNPLFEGNLQHDAQELLRCLLCELDEAEAALRHNKQKREDECKMARKPDLLIGNSLENASSDLSSCEVEKRRFLTEGALRVAPKQPVLKGGRRRRKKEEVSAASKGLLASFLNAQEVPEIPMKVIELQQEPIEGVSLDKDSDLCIRSSEGTKSNFEGSQVSCCADSCITDQRFGSFSSSIFSSRNTSPLSISGSKGCTLPNTICCGESSRMSSISSHCESGRAANSLPSSSFPSRDIDSYLTSVKNTEGRRSRLGVRGKARTSVVRHNKISSFFRGPSLDDNLSLPTSSVRDGTNLKDIKEEKVFEKTADTYEIIQNGVKEIACLSVSKSNPEQFSLLTDSSNCVSVPVDDTIIECALSQPSLTQKRKEKLIDFPQNDEKQSQEMPVEVGGGSPLLSLKPGKHITIHSPFSKHLVFYTPPHPRPRNVLSRLGHYLPHSAKRCLSFSEDSQRSRISQPSVLLPVSDEANSNETLNQVCQRIQEARIQLRRCDWLGVSPVKSVSARVIMKQISNSKQYSVSNVELGGTVTKDGQLTSSMEGTEPQQLGKRKLVYAAEDADEKGSFFTIDGTTGSGLPPRTKRFKSSSADTGDKGHKLKPGTTIDGKLLPKLSIKLEKCDWLMQSGGKSVKISAASTQDLKICTNKEGLSSSLERCTHSSAGIKVEPLSTSDQQAPSLVYNLFGGTLSHHTRCCECESVTDRSEEFLDISIPVPKSNVCSDNNNDDEAFSHCDNSVSLLLQSFMSRERMFGENKYLCENCHHLVEAERWSQVTTLPKVFVLHLKRFHANSSAFSGVSKINDHITVPRHLPCLLHKCTSRQPTCEHGYDLYAVVTHSGSSICQGHYRTYVRVPTSFSLTADYKREQRTVHPWPCDRGDSQSNLSLHETFSNASSCGTSFSQSSMENSSQDQCFKEDPASKAKDLPPSSLSFKMPSMKGDGDTYSPLWLECDDEVIRVFAEEEFFGKLSETNGYLLGTPYVLFYHRK